MLTVWLAEDAAVVLFAGPHSNTAGDLYDQLLRALGVEPPEEERKPPSCDDEGAPPMDEEIAEAITHGRRTKRDKHAGGADPVYEVAPGHLLPAGRGPSVT